MGRDRLFLEKRRIYIWEGVLIKLSELGQRVSTFVQTNAVRSILS